MNSSQTAIEVGQLIQLWVPPAEIEIGNEREGVLLKGTHRLLVEAALSTVLSTALRGRKSHSGLAFQVVVSSTAPSDLRDWTSPFSKYLASANDGQEWSEMGEGCLVRKIPCGTRAEAEASFRLLDQEALRVLTNFRTMSGGSTRVREALKVLEEAEQEEFDSSAPAKLVSLLGRILARAQVRGTEHALKELKLDQHSIESLVSAEAHEELYLRTIAARQCVGLDALQPALEAYSHSISKGCKPPWDISTKARIRSLMNAFAAAAGAVFENEGHRGLIHVSGGGRGTFQLRSQSGEKQRSHGIGQQIEGVRMVAASPSGSRRK